MPAAVECMTSLATTQTAVMEPSTSDKKRNKLGYHRTSVACVHCRRRKIRCLVAADDPQGRCENCIRLRKECQFFPVDQQPPIEKKSRPASRIETISTDPSTASSSPPNAAGDQAEAFFPYQPMPLSSGPEVAFNAPAYPGNPMASFAPGDASGSLDPSVPWDEFTTLPSDPQMLASMSASKQGMMNMPTTVWSQPGTPIAGAVPSTALPGAPTVPSQPQPLSPGSPSYTVQPDGSVWQMTPTRSMSFPAQTTTMAPPYSSPTGFAQPIPADPKHRMTTSPVQASYPVSQTDVQSTSVPVSYPLQQAAVGYPAWQEMNVNGMQSVNMVPYPVYTGDPTQQAAAFGSPPMGHGNPHPQ